MEEEQDKDTTARAEPEKIKKCEDNTSKMYAMWLLHDNLIIPLL